MALLCNEGINFESITVEQLAKLDDGTEFLPSELLESAKKMMRTTSAPLKKRKQRTTYDSGVKRKIDNHIELAKHFKELCRVHPGLLLDHFLPLFPDPAAHGFPSVAQYEQAMEDRRPDGNDIPWEYLKRQRGCVEALFFAWFRSDRKLGKILPLFPDLLQLWQFPTHVIDSYVKPSPAQQIRHKILLKVRTQDLEREALLHLVERSAFWPDPERFGAIVLNDNFFGANANLPIFQDVIIPVSAKLDDKTIWMEMRLTQRLVQMTCDALLSWNAVVACHRLKNPQYCESAEDRKTYFIVWANEQKHWYEFEEPQDSLAFNYTPDLANYFVPHVNKEIAIANYIKCCKSLEDTKQQIQTTEARLWKVFDSASTAVEQDMNYFRIQAEMLVLQKRLGQLWEQHKKLENDRASISQNF